MHVIRATQQMLETRTLVIGFQGENLRTQLRIDCSPTFAEYPNATPALAIKPPAGETYPVFVERDGNEVVWDIVANNLVLKGDGELQLTFYKDNVIAKTVIGTIRVNRSLQIDGEMPDVVATWIENANRKLAEVDAQIVELEGMVDTATEAAQSAAESAEIATEEAVHAEGSAETATAKANEATQAAGTATAKAAEAQTAAQTATEKATAAAESERIATAKAVEATTAAGTATTKAEQATEAAETATEKAGDASASATAAHTSEINAAESADDALSAEVGANAAKRAAETSATQAGISEQNAGTAAQTATQKATEASQSATDAATSAGTATTKAEEAEASAQAAQDAQTAVEQTAEQLADSLEQIDQNTQDIAELDERKANIDGYYPDMTVGNAEQLNSSKYVENSEPYTLRTSGGTSDIGNREYVDAVVGGTLAWNQAVRDGASENSTDFADIVTVTDAVEDAAGVKVKLEPVQDLHGYSNPWPAGGGKNLLNLSDYGAVANYTINSDGTITVNSSDGGAWDARPIIPLKSGTYTVSYSAASGNLRYKLSEDNYTEEFTTAVSKTFTLTADGGIRFKFGLGASAYPITIKVQLESGSTATSWTPYSNICPIIGWDGVQVWDDPRYGGLVEWNQLARMSKNAYTHNGITYTASNGVYSVNGTSSGVSYSTVTDSAITNNHVYLMSLKQTSDSISIWQLGYTGQRPSTAAIVKNNSSNQFGLYIEAGKTVNDSNVIPQVFDLTQMFGVTKADEIYAMEQAEAGVGVAYFRALFPNDYYAYNAGQSMTVGQVNGETYRHYTIQMPTEAGTVYGGELTVNTDGSGSLVVDRVTDTFTKDSEWYGFQTGTGNSSAVVQLSNYQNVKYINNYASFNGAISSIGTEYANYWTAGRPNEATNTDFAFAYSANGLLRVHRSDVGTITDLESFKNAFPDAQFCYYLATPITYTLTPSEIRTLLGTNNVWSDAGQLALTYTGTDEHLTLESGKKYLTRINGTDSMLLGSGQEITAAKGTDNVFDLTKMFGTAVADYVYGQGAAFFRKWFPNTRYPYNAGELKHVEGLQSHDMVGFNQWDEEVRHGYYNEQTGAFVESSAYCANKNPIPAFPNTVYYGTEGSTYVDTFLCYDSGMNYLGTAIRNADNTRTTRPNTAFINFRTRQAYGGTYKHDICISLVHNGSRNGEYEPYEKHSYPLDSTVILRGIPKVGANGVYWDGDRYLPDGTVERKYGVVEITSPMVSLVQSYSNVVYAKISKPTDSADKSKATSKCVHGMFATNAAISNWDDASKVQQLFGGADYLNYWFGFPIGTTLEQAKSVLVGTELVYELATPTTETAQPYHSTQWVSDWGTEEFVSTGLVPVGHETRYPANLRDKLQHLPDAASGNGSYLITQTDGQMVLTPFPAPPSTAGNYVLKATVTGGVATYTWEVAT